MFFVFMGGGDLNLKKSWHPLTVRNQEKVWKLEQQKLEEEKKSETLQKELRRERQVQELRRLQAASGVLGTTAGAEKMDWMYAGATQRSTSFQEDFLLGKRTVDEILDDGASKGMMEVPTLATAPAKIPFPLAPEPIHIVKRDMEAKIREDPLFAIKMKEQESIKEMAKNPLIIKRLKKEQSARSSRRDGWSLRSNSSHIATPTKTPLSSYDGRRKPPTWSMSEEERAARLAEMQSDAKAHHEDRFSRVKKHAREDKEEQEQLHSSYQKRHVERDFLDDVQEKAFSTKSNTSLAARLSTYGRKQRI